MSAEAAVGCIEPERLVDPQARVIDYLRVSVTDRCNYGCSYCIPHDGVEHAPRADVLSFEEIAALVRVFVSLGVRRVRLTGGEPTVRRDLPALVRLLRAIPGIDDIALSTNGHLLAELAAPLRAAGVDRAQHQPRFARRRSASGASRAGVTFRACSPGIEAARAAGFASIKLNTVAIARRQRRRIRPHLRLGVGARPGAALHRGDADGGRARLSAGRARDGRRRSAAASPPPGRARGSSLKIPTPRSGAGPARYFRLEPDEHGGGPRAPLRDHLADDRALLHHLQPAAAVDGGRAARLSRVRRRRRPARSPARRGAPTRSPGRSGRRSRGKRPGHTFQLIGLGGPRKAMVQIGG